MLINETAERNDKNNWVKKRLIRDGFKIISFEGFSIKNGKVSGLFDRRNYTDIDFEHISDSQIIDLITQEEKNLQTKLEFAACLNVNYRYVFYSYQTEHVYVYRFASNLYPSKLSGPMSFCEFAEKTKFFRDLSMVSNYHEDQLPEFDKILRNKCKIPWPGNLDGLLLDNKTEKSKALIEFQTTIKTKVKDHCNNEWFKPKGNRKGDEQRWIVAWNISKHSGLPLFIIVWSPKEENGDIKFKIVSDVVPIDSNTDKEPGLKYKTNDLIKYDELVARLKKIMS